MTGVLMLESLTRGNTLKQGDKTPLTYKLLDADGDNMSIAGKQATVRLVFPNYLTIGYEKSGLVVSQDDTVTFTIDNVIPARKYHVEIIVDNKFVFPSRSVESKFTIDKSSLGTETNIIEIIGKDVLIREVKSQVDTDLQPLVTSLESAQQAEVQRASEESSRASAEAQRQIDHANRSAEMASKADKVVIRNQVANGDFSEGTNNLATGFLLAISTTNPRLVDGVQYWTGSTTAYAGSLRWNSNLNSGDIYYISAVTSNVAIFYANELLLDTRSVDGLHSSTFVLASDFGSVTFRVREINQESSVSNLQLINLTQTFGAGNEPTKEEMDELIEITGYVDSENGLNVKDMLVYLMNSKANKSVDLAGKADKVVLKNGLVNGDFSDGVTRWGGVLGELQAGSDMVIFTPASGASRIAQNTVMEINHVYYHAMRVKATGSTPHIYPTNPLGASQSIKGSGEWEVVSVNHKPVTNNADIRYVYNGTVGVPIEVDWILRIDLTETFGAGNEPTQEEMERLIEIAGYIDGGYTLNNNEMIGRLLKGVGEKADKKQEDWITATLMNGATGDVKYRKNDFGRVEFTGYIKLPTEHTSSYVMSIASGYRPKADIYLPAGLDSFGVGSVLYFRPFANGDSVWANNVWAGRTAYLDGLSYFN